MTLADVYCRFNRARGMEVETHTHEPHYRRDAHVTCTYMMRRTLYNMHSTVYTYTVYVELYILYDIEC